jgi:UDP-2,4-diacetamido-2,4,6-trideoxy-beta-L-altropyranose hydrolase
MPGDFCGYLEDRGFSVKRLNHVDRPYSLNTIKGESYSSWRGVSLSHEIAETRSVLFENGPFHWLVVDHYGLGWKWETEMGSCVESILVIDDLVNRRHSCNVLLNCASLPKLKERYEKLVPKFTKILSGPKYFLLHPEFRKIRKTMPLRDGIIRRVVIFYGGIDEKNDSSKALRAISDLNKSAISIDVVIGKQNIHRKEVEKLVGRMPNTFLHIQLPSLATILANASLALGSGGSNTLERIYMNLPSIVTTSASNQVPGTRYLHEKQLLLWLGDSNNVSREVLRNEIDKVIRNPEILLSQSTNMKNVVDGKGVRRVAEAMGTF